MQSPHSTCNNLSKTQSRQWCLLNPPIAPIIKAVLLPSPFSSMISSCIALPFPHSVSLNTWGSLLPMDLCTHYFLCPRALSRSCMANTLSCPLGSSVTFLESRSFSAAAPTSHLFWGHCPVLFSQMALWDRLLNLLCVCPWKCQLLKSTDSFCPPL